MTETEAMENQKKGEVLFPLFQTRRLEPIFLPTPAHMLITSTDGLAAISGGGIIPCFATVEPWPLAPLLVCRLCPWGNFTPCMHVPVVVVMSHVPSPTRPSRMLIPGWPPRLIIKVVVPRVIIPVITVGIVPTISSLPPAAPSQVTRQMQQLQYLGIVSFSPYPCAALPAPRLGNLDFVL